MLLTFEVRPNGGVVITGSIEHLCDLIGWIVVAIKTGEAHPTYVADEMAEVKIVCAEGDER
jgi:hypothetical protein